MSQRKQKFFRKLRLVSVLYYRHYGNDAAIFCCVCFLCGYLTSCKPVQYVSASHQVIEPKKSTGGLGMTYKTKGNSKTAAPLATVSGKNKSARKADGAFHVFERSKKKRKPDLSLFPAGVSNKFRLKDRHTNEKKAARLLKKDEKAQVKAKEKKTVN